MQAQGMRGPGNSGTAQASTHGPDPARAAYAPTSTEAHATGLPGSERGLISEHLIEAIEEEEPPQSTELDVELLPDTPGNQSGDRDSYNLTVLHFNDVYDLEPSTKEPVGGAARCGPSFLLPDPAGGMEVGNAGNMQEGFEAARESFILILLGH